MKWWKVRRLIRRNIYIRLALIIGSCFVLGTVGMYLVERNTNADFASLGEAFWSSTVYILSGFEDRAPITIGGKIISIFIFIASIGILGAVVGKFASEFLIREVVKMPKDITGHIAICNWNDRGDRIIRELHSPQAEPDTEIVIITKNKPSNEEELRRANKAYERVYFIESDPVIHDVLKASRIHQAKSVLILSDEESPDPDAKSALIALAVSKLCNTESRPHIVAEVMNHRKMEHLIDAGADEVICAADYGLGILAQCALHAKLSAVYDNLLTYSGNTNEIYMVEGNKFPRVVIGKTFLEATEMINKNRCSDNPTILIGVRRGNRVVLNPKENWEGPGGEKFETFQEDDGLIVMAFSPPDLSNLEKG